jgi:hypothetical protein
MSTENIPGLEEVEELLGRAGKAAAARRGANRKEHQGRVRQEENLARGAASVIKKSVDKRKELDEELDQLDHIEGMAQALLGAREPAEPAQAEPTPAVEPDLPAEAEVTPEEPPAPATTPVPVVVAEPNPHNPVNWTGWQWFGGFIGVIVGLIVSNITYEDAGSHVGGDFSWAFTLLYFIAVIGIGFFLGGLVGGVVERAVRARRTTNQ